MPTMRAAIYQGIREIVVTDVERDGVEPGTVIVDTKQSGICGSDLHSYFGEWGQSKTYASGHETCGVVEEVGAGVSGIEVGDLVTMECFSHCGECVFCRTGAYNQCLRRGWISQNAHAGFAEYTRVHASGVFRLPSGMTYEQGALVEPLAVGVRAVAQSRATYADRVLVIGGGTIGLCCLAAACAAGVRETFATVKYEHQEAAARDLGANYTIRVPLDSPRQFVRKATDGIGADVVIEATGSDAAFDEALACVRRQGFVVLVAGYHRPLTVSLGAVVWSEASIIGSNCYGYSGIRRDFDAAIDLISSGRVNASRLVTHRLPLEDAAEAFKIAADKNSGSIKVHLCQ